MPVCTLITHRWRQNVVRTKKYALSHKHVAQYNITDVCTLITSFTRQIKTCVLLCPTCKIWLYNIPLFVFPVEHNSNGTRVTPAFTCNKQAKKSTVTSLRQPQKTSSRQRVKNIQHQSVERDINCCYDLFNEITTHSVLPDHIVPSNYPYIR